MSTQIDCFFIGYNAPSLDETKLALLTETEQKIDYFYSFRSAHTLYNISALVNCYCQQHGLPPLPEGYVLNGAIAYLGSFLHRRGFSFGFSNWFQTEKDVLAQRLAQDQILAIAITTTYYVSPAPIVEIIRFIRQYNQTAKIILGGAYIYDAARGAAAPEDLAQLWQLLDADFVIVSPQGETALVNLLHALKHDHPVDHINNLWYKTARGYLATTSAPETNDLADNRIDWRLFADHVGEYALVRSTAGCPFACAFCTYPPLEMGDAYRYLSVADVEQELNQLHAIPSVRYLEFIDSTFNVPPKRCKELLRMFIRNRYRFQWFGQLRCQFVDEEMAVLLRESGCLSVLLGLESGSDQMLKAMQKQATIAEYRKGIAWLKKYEILPVGSFIVGFPGETIATIHETIQFINDTALDLYHFNHWYCSPLSPIWKVRTQYQITGQGYEWRHLTMDWQTALELQKEMVLSIHDQSVYNPYDHNAFAENQIYAALLAQGVPLSHIKAIFSVFTRALKEKLQHPEQTEISVDIVEALRSI